MLSGCTGHSNRPTALPAEPGYRSRQIPYLRRSFGTGQEEVVQQMDKWCGQVDTLMLLQRSPELFAVLQEIMGEYMDGLISPEQCAQKLQERAEIYLQE